MEVLVPDHWARGIFATLACNQRERERERESIRSIFQDFCILLHLHEQKARSHKKLYWGKIDFISLELGNYSRLP